ncbi:hypothetical protein N9777_03380 [Ascidiaceihabitans sp.]|nr:hypothetical protein [Ascidiaceihabitans sp.]
MARADYAFCQHILNTGQGGYAVLRQILRRRYALSTPENMPDESYDRGTHRTVFLSFLNFLKGTLSGQTAIHIDATWCTQAQSLQGFGDFSFPKRVIREVDLERELPQLLESIGYTGWPVALAGVQTDILFEIARIYDSEIQSAAQAAYQRDYMMLGFKS